MSIAQRINSFFWPETLGDIQANLSTSDPSQKESLKHFRIFALMIFAGIYFHSYFALDGSRIFYVIAYTEWGLFFTGVEFVLLTATSFFETGGILIQKLHEAAYIMFEISWTSEFVITIIFWAVLVVVDIEKANEYDLDVIIFMCESHLIPIILISIDFYRNQMRFSKRHGIFVAIPPALFSATSAFFALVYNIIAYPILTWRDYKTIVFGLLIISMFFAGFYAGYFLGERRYSKRTRRSLRREQTEAKEALLNVESISSAISPTL